MGKPEQVLLMPDAFACRLCGSSYLQAADQAGLCVACWDEFNRWIESVGVTDKTEYSINRWMARRLMLDASRLARYGMTGRCEAVAGRTRGWLDGWDMQCRSRATGMRDGRRVCFQHSNATKPVFVGSEAHDPYIDMERVLTELAKSDLRFRKALEGALAAVAVQ